jgi:hypothetical protein
MPEGKTPAFIETQLLPRPAVGALRHEREAQQATEKQTANQARTVS